MSKNNINLPKTAFSMKANLQNKEPGIIDYWNKIDLYNKNINLFSIVCHKNFYKYLSFPINIYENLIRQQILYQLHI